MRYLSNALATCTLLACSATVIAAPIIWDPAQNTTGASDVATVGSLVEATNATTTSTGSVTINGVTFQNKTGVLADSFEGALAGEDSGDPGYNSLLNTFNFGGGTTTTITIADGLLTTGSPYLIQVWYTDLRGFASDRVMSFAGDTGGAVQLDASGNGLGQFAIGRFTADGASQTLSLATNGFPNAHITGYQIRSVPEPATVFLIGSGFVALGFALAATRRRGA